MRRVILAAASILTAFLLQNSVLWTFSPLDVVPNLLLIVTVTYGLTCGKRIGMLIGAVCGILSDTFIGDGGLGFYMLIYIYAGALCGVFHGFIYSEEQLFPVVMIGLCDFAFGGYVYVFRFLIRGRLDMMSYVTGTIMPEVVFTVFAAILFYPLIYGLDRHLILTKKRRTSSFV
ncbi:MAG: rod shape-determining protein MreD [Lachnospiraceae bacterium]|nr:rod shape-determining protein MreD [Lachnospiraceae bacterium]